MIKCVVCEREVAEELDQDFHDKCMNNFVEEMDELKKTNPKEYERLRREFYS